jgi:hypothetical protein
MVYTAVIIPDTSGTTPSSYATLEMVERLTALYGKMQARIDALEAKVGALEQRLATFAPVTVTTYNAVASQCDSDPNITASGRRSRPGFQCALSRDMERRLGAKFGDVVFVKGVPSRPPHGGWMFADRMARRWKKKVDLMLPPGWKHFKAKREIVLVRR